MKKAILILAGLVFCACSKGYRAPTDHKQLHLVDESWLSTSERSDTHLFQENRAFSPQHYKLLLTLNPQDKTFSGIVVISVQRLHLSEPLVLDVDDSLTVDGVALNSQAMDNFERSDNQIRIPADAIIPDNFQLTVNYHTSVPKLGGYFVSVGKKVAQFWTHGEPLDARGWIPSFDWPNFKATTDFFVTVPASWQVLSNGSLVHEEKTGFRKTYHWTEHVPIASYLFSIMAGEFKTVRVEDASVPITYWIPQGEDARNTLGFNLVPEMVKFYSDLLTPYPFEKFDVGIAYNYSGAMEHASAVTFAQNMQSSRDGYDSSVVAHELAHHWFGDLVTCDTWNDLWLNEGFASYFEVLFWEREQGRNKYFDRMLTYRELYMEAEAGTKNTLGPIYNPQTSPVQKFNLVSYNKGALFLHQLRYVLGDPAFFNGLRDYLNSYHFKSATTSDLKKSLETSTGRNLDYVFQWVFKPLYPSFDYKWSYIDGVVKVTVEQTQKEDLGLYNTPIDLWIIYDGRLVKNKVEISAKSQEFTYRLVHKPEMVLLDPERWILADIKGVKQPEELAAMMSRGPTVDSKVEALVAYGKNLTFDQWKRYFEQEKSEIIKYALLRKLADVQVTKGSLRPLMLSLLDSPMDYVRMGAVENWKLFAEKPDEDKFIQLYANDPFRYVSLYAGQALGQFGSEKAGEAFLTELFREPLRNQIIPAIMGLGALKYKKAIPRLKELLEENQNQYASSYMKPLIGMALAAMDKPLESVMDYRELTLRMREILETRR